MDKAQIRFIDSHYKTLFCIEDGGEIEIGDGSSAMKYACHYIDEHHTWIGDRVYHICEFAQNMERYNRSYRPAQKREAI